MDERRFELISTVLLALATLATAWAAYQAREWTGEQALSTSSATATRIAVNRAAAVANRQEEIDIETFIQWIDARKEGRPGLAAFYRARFRDEFKPVFAAWLAQRPFDNPDAPSSPFETARYKLAKAREADRLEASAGTAADDAKEANERADNYMLGVVLFALSLFFAGLSTKLHTARARMVILGCGWVVFLVAAVWLATLPVELTG